MTLAIKLAIIAALILSIFIPFGYFLHGERTKKRYKRSIAFNAFFFFGIIVIAGVMMFVTDPVQHKQVLMQEWLQDLDIWQQHYQQDFLVLVVVSP